MLLTAFSDVFAKKSTQDNLNILCAQYYLNNSLNLLCIEKADNEKVDYLNNQEYT
ncbi:hypothetical protein BT1A1_2289 [Caldibacillus thermoamylovorans]|uniref:Uncharacterized protein n=1 Tax=Caldibacillus thermoamylovorans TaxID=35841 RepID=A0A090J2L0_9BACI|nr:hypothetical protein BT1A1_2289 [Caldibacillus thermoamylovorans]